MVTNLAKGLMAVGAVAAQMALAEELTDNDFLTEQTLRSSKFTAEDYTFKFNVSFRNDAGSAGFVNLGTDPINGALTHGSQFLSAELEPCAVVTPHVHPRADETLFLISGVMEAGFVDESGTFIGNEDVTEGQAFVIPQGYIHYYANPTCEKIKVLGAYSTRDAGSYTAFANALRLPPKVTKAIFPNLSIEEVEAFRDSTIVPPIPVIDASCAAHCAEMES